MFNIEKLKLYFLIVKKFQNLVTENTYINGFDW